MTLPTHDAGSTAFAREARNLSPNLIDLHDRLLLDVPPQAAHLVLLLVEAIAQHAPSDGVTAALSADLSTADGLSALGDRLKSLGLIVPATAAFEMAAHLDLADKSLWDGWGGPFNGREWRQSLFRQLLQCIRFSAVVETGTFRGSTTEFMAKETGVPVFSCELSERFFRFAGKRLVPHNNVRLFCTDSRAFLREILLGDMVGGGPVFFYLDAHWGQDLPLWDEISIIYGHAIDTVIMIDDFRVPGDVGFGYDDYGPGKRLTTVDLRPNLPSATDLFFPRYPSGVETGAKRGVVVLAREDLSDSIARNVPSLDRVDWRRAMLLDAVQQEMSILRKEAARSSQDANGYKRDAAALRQEADGLREQVTTLRQQGALLQQEVGKCHEQVTGLREQVAAWQREAAALRSEIEAIRSSTSWRITAPLRALRSQLRRM